MRRNIRTRFAPSPTGHLHIGNARTAIMNWLFARHGKGRFILRIEDTDRERSTAASEQAILEDLRWLGLGWDEGPDVGGDYGPYRQSERTKIYETHVRLLEASGKVYRCYCRPEELETRRKQLLEKGENVQYDGRCRRLGESERKQFEDEGRKPALRFRVEEDEVVFEDLVKGRVSFRAEHMGDFILARPDGMPMYNFACVVDDHSMGISHVIRGDDHVSNTPRQVLLYKAFGWELPVFAHIPMILGKDRVRLSKRHGATAISQYRALGYLSEALVNFLSLLSWSSESGEEVLSVNRLVEAFDFQRVSKAASIFDVEKLDWMNGVYIRNLDTDRLAGLMLPFFRRAGYPVSSESEVRRIAALLQDKLERLLQVEAKAKIFFQEEVVAEDAEVEAILNESDSQKVYQAFLEEMRPVKTWDGEGFRRVMKRVQEKTGVRGKGLWMPIRAALTGQLHGPELPGVVEILGYEKCRRFVERALGGKG